MIGRSEETACPTVCFISANPQLRKEARKVIKESGILLKYAEYKTAHMSRDPACGEELEELASQPGRGEIRPGTEVYYERSRSRDFVGMPIYVCHTSGLRAATGSAVQIFGCLVYLVPAHVFSEKSGSVETFAVGLSTLAVNANNDFELDSDDEETEEPSADTDSPGVVRHSYNTAPEMP
jgi:hypothetical protein